MEDFGYSKEKEENYSSALIKRAFLIGATLFSIALFFYITMSAYYFFVQDRNNIEIIKASADPIKVVEFEETTNQEESIKIDSSIYDDIFGTRKKPKEVKIRENVEAAIPPKEILANNNAPNNTAAPSPTSSNMTKIENSQSFVTKFDEKNNQVEKVEVQNNQQNQAGKIIVYSENEVKKDDTILNNKKTEKQNEVKKVEKISNDKKKYIRVQIAAMTSKEAANQHISKLKKQYLGIFSGLKEYVEEVDLGKRGIFYRVQIGNFYDQVRAENFCRKYVAQTQKSKADCIVVE